MVGITRLVTWVALVGAMTVAAGCGERPDAAPTGDASASATIVVPATEPPATAAAATDAAAAATTAVSDTTDADAVDSATSTPSTEPLGGVTIDDPLPVQVDAATDPVAAEVAVRFAYQHWLLVDLDPTLRGTLLENGEANAQQIDAKLQDLRGTIEFGRIHVETVAFTDVEHAAVTFRITWQDGPSPIFPNEMTGAAVFQNGTWRVAGTTLCVLAFGVNTGCSATEAPNPTAPDALAVITVPGGITWQGLPGSDDVVNVGGAGGLWAVSSEDGTIFVDDGLLQVSAQALVGVSALGGADLDAVLDHGSFGGPDSEPADIGGRPGRVQVDGAAVAVVVIRADDTVVRAWSQGLTVEEVVAAVASMVPAERVPEAELSPDGVIVVEGTEVHA